ncbi:hypothetical protein ALC62_10183 [Cyphomyrmex costatus]|uniref:Uncharacterized protein n=1 Tax=Cyphomyrmex costatus TaxID=456900 RepID=A0A195CDW8_9HYME|nr:hypothetical protein ALC62_10183 [Cyphomyrmex costatus]
MKGKLYQLQQDPWPRSERASCNEKSRRPDVQRRAQLPSEVGRNDGTRYVDVSTCRRSVPPSGKRSQTARVRLHFLRQTRGKSLIGKSPSDYEAWKPSRRAHGALRAGGDSFRFVDEGAGSSSSSSLLRKIRSPDNCDLSSREGNPKRGGKRNRARRKEEEEKGRETVPENTTCSDTTNLLQGAFGTSCVNSEYKLVCRGALEIMSFLRKGTHIR